MKAIIRNSDNAVLFFTNVTEKHDLTGCKVVNAPVDYAQRRYLYNGTAFMEDVAAVEADLLAQAKVEAERRKMTFLSPGGAKKAEYPKKQAEVAFFDSLGGTVANALAALNLMSADAQLTKFPYALASARLRGEPTIVPAIGRFRAGMRKALKVEDVAAVEELACETIKAGTTAAAKRAAFAAIIWP